MRRPAHRYLHLEPAIPDVVIGPVTAALLVALFTGAVFYGGFRVGGEIRYRQGHADGVEEYTALIETAIQDGTEIVMKRGKGKVRYRFNVISKYQDPTISF